MAHPQFEQSDDVDVDLGVGRGDIFHNCCYLKTVGMDLFRISNLGVACHDHPRFPNLVYSQFEYLLTFSEQREKNSLIFKTFYYSGGPYTHAHHLAPGSFL